MQQCFIICHHVMSISFGSHSVTELLKRRAQLLPENLRWLLFFQGFSFSSLAWVSLWHAVCMVAAFYGAEF